jgi:hypothetical protein
VSARQPVLCAVPLLPFLTMAPVFPAGRELDFKVTAGSRRTSALAFARTMIPVDSAGAPRCAMISAACAPARPAQIIGQAADEAATPAAGSSDSTITFVPPTPSNVDTSKTEAVGACDRHGLERTRHVWLFVVHVALLVRLGYILQTYTVQGSVGS